MEKSIYSAEHKFLVQQLQHARKDAGLSQKDAARLLEKTQSYISKVESGQSRIDIIELQHFAAIYKKPLDFFIANSELLG
ncbi:MAG: helix-turn-helix transcriptional regulator [Candidatus Kerfeldbacteria bacterium]|nr:helix-turn-helix transcriptional regulator [Candidatus Kerfeldbacteria bacterium]